MNYATKPLDTTDEQLNELIRERIRQGSLQRECIDEVIFTTEESVPLSTETYSRLDEFFWNQLEIALRLQEPED